MATKAILFVDVEGRIYDPDPERDRPTWREYAEELGIADLGDAAGLAEVLEYLEISEEELDREVPDDWESDSFSERGRYGVVWLLLASLETEPGSEDIFEFVDGPSPGDSSRYVVLLSDVDKANQYLESKGCRMELKFPV